MIDFMQMTSGMASLLLVLGLISIAYFLLKRHPRWPILSIPGIKIQGRAKLSHHHQLILLEYDGQEILILLLPQSAQILMTRNKK